MKGVLGFLAAAESLAHFRATIRELLSVLAHLLITLTTLLGPGGVKAVVAENILLKQQLLIVKLRGCPRKAQQLDKACGIQTDKDRVRGVVATHYRTDGGEAPS